MNAYEISEKDIAACIESLRTDESIPRLPDCLQGDGLSHEQQVHIKKLYLRILAERSATNHWFKEAKMFENLAATTPPQYPDGKISEDDEGALNIAMGTNAEKGIIEIHFAKPITWLGLDKSSAQVFLTMLTRRVEELCHS